MKLMMSGKFKVTLADENSTKEFEVLFDGPADSPYEGVSKTDVIPLTYLGRLESSSTIARSVPLQVTIDRIQK